MDFSAVIGILMGFTALVGGNLLEGGRIESILQPTAAFIVFGGTCGATILSFPLADIINAIRSFKDIFRSRLDPPEDQITKLVNYSITARKKGLLALESELDLIEDDFFKKALKLAIDGQNPALLKETMEQEIVTHEQKRQAQAKVFETAGGFAPTIGIIGAVLGLIHVMENLTEPSKLGAGIAVAFVATIYGVGVANLALLPISKKLLNIMKKEVTVKEILIEGAVGIQTGINPYYLRERLNAFLEKAR